VVGSDSQNQVMTDTAAQPPSVEEFLALMPEGMGRLNEKMGIELVEITAARVVATMPVEGNTQPYGLLHGGASVVLAETLGSVGSALHGAPDRLSVGVDINATHHRAVRAGLLTGVATAVHLGRTMASYEVVISDERGKRVCTSRITCALVPAAAVS
jgi:1,4-dihydroxy-2-naphthoyl-CoA hydrolase